MAAVIHRVLGVGWWATLRQIHVPGMQAFSNPTLYTLSTAHLHELTSDFRALGFRGLRVSGWALAVRGK